MCNAYARINCISSIDTVRKILFYNCSEYDILCGVLDVIIWYRSLYDMDNGVNGSK